MRFRLIRTHGLLICVRFSMRENKATCGTGYAFSVVQKLLAWAKKEANSDRQERCGQKNI